MSAAPSSFAEVSDGLVRDFPVFVQGAARMDTLFQNDLDAYIKAHRHDLESVVPSIWTPEWVMARLIASMEVVHKTAGRIGPAKVGTAWPSILREWADLVDDVTKERLIYRSSRMRGRPINWESEVDPQTKRLLQDDAEETQRQRGNRPTSLEIELSDEAMGWCARYLGDTVMAGNALQTWAWCQARGASVAAVLRLRGLKADAMVTRRQAGEDELRKSRRQEIAARAAAWANARIPTARDDAHIKHIRANAHIRFERECAARVDDVGSVKIKRRDVMPGRVFAARVMDEHRKLGAAIIAEGLQRDKVTVR